MRHAAARQSHGRSWRKGDRKLPLLKLPLLMLAAIAMTAITMIGIAAERRDLHRRYQANTLRRRVLSYFYLGCCVITRNDASIAAADLFSAARHHFFRVTTAIRI